MKDRKAAWNGEKRERWCAVCVGCATGQHRGSSARGTGMLRPMKVQDDAVTNQMNKENTETHHYATESAPACTHFESNVYLPPADMPPTSSMSNTHLLPLKDCVCMHLLLHEWLFCECCNVLLPLTTLPSYFYDLTAAEASTASRSVVSSFSICSGSYFLQILHMSWVLVLVLFSPSPSQSLSFYL